MIVPEKQGETCYVLNLENDTQGQGVITVMHYTMPNGIERVEVLVEIGTDTTSEWVLRRERV